MGIKKAISIGLSCLILSTGFIMSSCSGSRAGTSSHGISKTKQMKKNKSRYGTRFSQKVKPARKDYVIRNKRR